jgi:predicted membrane chloride channel (bestrophin family)
MSCRLIDLWCVQNGAVIPSTWPSLTVEAGEAFNLTSFALSLLLVFRTNESYSRWLEARKAWSSILVRSRDFVRQVFIWTQLVLGVMSC